jgi:hypothetical protein
MTATAADAPVSPGDRLALLFEELSELTGQRNAIDGRIVEIVAEIDRDGLWGATGARSLAALVLTCDATGEVWFERGGEVIGSGRSTRTISRRLRRALEHRDRSCAVPGCGATRGLHAHHIRHWEDGGETELHNLVLLCPYHHRLHHRGIITITGPADRLLVTDSDGDQLQPGSLARPPGTPPPSVPPCPGPLGERADWWWYTPFQPQAPPSNN